MSAVGQNDVSTLLVAIQAGRAGAKDELVHLIYQELHQLASYFLGQAGEAPSLQPTALLNEALMRLLGSKALERAPNRAYLFGSVARAMRRVIADHARKRMAQKRGGDLERQPLDALLAYYEDKNLDVVALHDALEQLETLHDRASQVVSLRFFGGFSMPEIAERLNVSLSTVESDYRFARAWLRKCLKENEP